MENREGGRKRTALRRIAGSPDRQTGGSPASRCGQPAGRHPPCPEVLGVHTGHGASDRVSPRGARITGGTRVPWPPRASRRPARPPGRSSRRPSRHRSCGRVPGIWNRPASRGRLPRMTAAGTSPAGAAGIDPDRPASPEGRLPSGGRRERDPALTRDRPAGPAPGRHAWRPDPSGDPSRGRADPSPSDPRPPRRRGSCRSRPGPCDGNHCGRRKPCGRRRPSCGGAYAISPPLGSGPSPSSPDEPSRPSFSRAASPGRDPPGTPFLSRTRPVPGRSHGREAGGRAAAGGGEMRDAHLQADGIPPQPPLCGPGSGTSPSD
jgi:hypothetical protein